VADGAGPAGGAAFAAGLAAGAGELEPARGQEATHHPATRCKAGGWSLFSARPSWWGWVVAGWGSQRWWVIAAAAAQGSGQATAK
jgi:hypothetical protein